MLLQKRIGDSPALGKKRMLSIPKHDHNILSGAEIVTCIRDMNEVSTLSGTNMEVENGPLEDHVPLQTGGFPLPC